MNIIVDAFGGDNSPHAVIEGSAMAVEKLGVEITLSGNEKIIKDTAGEHNISLDKIKIVNADSVIDIHEEPTEIIKNRADSSMAVGLRQLSEGGADAFVSAGSTGALVVGSTFIAKRIKGIKRPALAPILPSEKGFFMLMDGGANVDCRPEMLFQFALMGSAYMQTVMNIENPKIGLVNVGTEETKGRDIEHEVYIKLSECDKINFGGNIEAREIPDGNFDVIITDGFTGNVILKLYEGMGLYFARTLKDMLKNGFTSKIAGMLIYDKVQNFKKKIDYTEVGGAVLMGISKPVIKAHGSSDANAFYNAIRQAKQCVDGKVTDKIKDSLVG